MDNIWLGYTEGLLQGIEWAIRIREMADAPLVVRCLSVGN